MANGTQKTRLNWMIRLCPLAAALLFVSCIDTGRLGPRAKRERETEVSAPMQVPFAFHTSIESGAISVQGADADECRLTAKILAYGANKALAKEAVEGVQVRLVPSAGGLEAVVDAPRSVNKADYSVSFTVVVPRATALKLATNNGKIRVKNIDNSVEAGTADGDVEIDSIKGDVHAKTHNGAVTCAEIEAGVIDLYSRGGGVRLSQAKANSCVADSFDGRLYLADVRSDTLDLRTTDGGIRCQNVAAKKLNCSSSDGPVYITWPPDAPRSPDITVALSSGSITFVGTADMSVVVDAFTATGSIKGDFPGVVKSRVENSVRATIGEGGGRLSLTTHDGSITIR
jgi:DUF4097 and DUF4098 domain-containing protein YvlB